jgi:hypothetical protein
MTLESAAQPRAVDEVLREWRTLSYRLAEAGDETEAARILRRLEALQAEARAATGATTIAAYTSVRVAGPADPLR